MSGDTPYGAYIRNHERGAYKKIGKGCIEESVSKPEKGERGCISKE